MDYTSKATGSTVVAMSGGVDSSCAAIILAESGNDCSGVTLRIVDEGADRAQIERESFNIALAADVCRRIGIPHFVLDARETFRKKVVEPFCEEYKAGRTPNPCILCNMFVKFPLIDRIPDTEPPERVATGHFADLVRPDEPGFPGFGGDAPLIRTATNKAKDQSYMLWGLYPNQTEKLVFPLHRISKEQVRQTVSKLGLAAEKIPESQDICFIPDGHFFSFIKTRHPEVAVVGDFIDSKGKKLGNHKGIAGYTIGQRRGLDVSGRERLYVIRIDPVENRIVLGTIDELLTIRTIVGNTRWGASLPGEQTGAVKIRYNQEAARARWRPAADDNSKIEVEFDSPQRAISPGQSAVFYKGRFMVGGGIIESWRSDDAM